HQRTVPAGTGHDSLRQPTDRSDLMSGADVRGYETRTTGREPEAEPEGKSVGAGERSRVAPLSGHPRSEPASRAERCQRLRDKHHGTRTRSRARRQKRRSGQAEPGRASLRPPSVRSGLKAPATKDRKMIIVLQSEATQGEGED